jgi:1-acyl-sn-glycerol-3-phosphate acyltransferase
MKAVAFLRVSFKGTALFSVIGWHLISGAAVFATVRNHHRRRQILVKLLSRSCQRALRALDMRVEIQSSEPLSEIKGHALFLSNHLSYLDVIAIAAYFPAAFVTSEEVRQSPGLGWIAACGGSFFVERRNAHRLRQDLRSIAHSLAHGVNVAVFPEATSGDGRAMKPFKRGLISAARLARVPVVPMCLNYEGANGQSLNRETADKLFYYGEMMFGPHILGVLKLSKIQVNLHLLAPLSVHEDESESVSTERAFAQVNQVFRPVA